MGSSGAISVGFRTFTLHTHWRMVVYTPCHAWQDLTHRTCPLLLQTGGLLHTHPCPHMCHMPFMPPPPPHPITLCTCPHNSMGQDFPGRRDYTHCNQNGSSHYGRTLGLFITSCFKFRILVYSSVSMRQNKHAAARAPRRRRCCLHYPALYTHHRHCLHFRALWAARRITPHTPHTCAHLTFTHLCARWDARTFTDIGRFPHAAYYRHATYWHCAHFI